MLSPEYTGRQESTLSCHPPQTAPTMPSLHQLCGSQGSSVYWKEHLKARPSPGPGPGPGQAVILCESDAPCLAPGFLFYKSTSDPNHGPFLQMLYVRAHISLGQ